MGGGSLAAPKPLVKPFQQRTRGTLGRSGRARACPRDSFRSRRPSTPRQPLRRGNPLRISTVEVPATAQRRSSPHRPLRRCPLPPIPSRLRRAARPYPFLHPASMALELHAFSVVPTTILHAFHAGKDLVSGTSKMCTIPGSMVSGDGGVCSSEICWLGTNVRESNDLRTPGERQAKRSQHSYHSSLISGEVKPDSARQGGSHGDLINHRIMRVIRFIDPDAYFLARDRDTRYEVVAAPPIFSTSILPEDVPVNKLVIIWRRAGLSMLLHRVDRKLCPSWDNCQLATPAWSQADRQALAAAHAKRVVTGAASADQGAPATPGNTVSPTGSTSTSTATGATSTSASATISTQTASASATIATQTSGAPDSASAELSAEVSALVTAGTFCTDADVAAVAPLIGSCERLLRLPLPPPLPRSRRRPARCLAPCERQPAPSGSSRPLRTG